MAQIYEIKDINDSRVGAYRNMPDRTLRGENIFVSEGVILTRRLLQSEFEVESVFATPEYVKEFAMLSHDDMPIYVAEESLMLDVVGFKFHRGVMAAGRRRAEASLGELLPKPERCTRLRLAVCPEITKPENMGLLFRAASGLGADALLFGERCCDPFSRRVLRVSMGAVLSMPYRKSTSIVDDLRELRERWKVKLFAAVLDAEAEGLDTIAWPEKAAILIGNEFDGLTAELINLCQRKVTITMARETDSLNLGVAAGIFLYEMMK